MNKTVVRALLGLTLSVCQPSVAHAEKKVIGVFGAGSSGHVKPKCLDFEPSTLELKQTGVARECRSLVHRVVIGYRDGFKQEIEFTDSSGRPSPFDVLELRVLPNTKCLGFVKAEVEAPKSGVCKSAALKYQLTAIN